MQESAIGAFQIMDTYWGNVTQFADNLRSRRCSRDAPRGPRAAPGPAVTRARWQMVRKRHEACAAAARRHLARVPVRQRLAGARSPSPSPSPSLILSPCLPRSPSLAVKNQSGAAARRPRALPRHRSRRCLGAGALRPASALHFPSRAERCRERRCSQRRLTRPATGRTGCQPSRPGWRGAARGRPAARSRCLGQRRPSSAPRWLPRPRWLWCSCARGAARGARRCAANYSRARRSLEPRGSSAARAGRPRRGRSRPRERRGARGGRGEGAGWD